MTYRYRTENLCGFVDWLGRTERACIVVKPGDVVKVKDIEIHALMLSTVLH